MKRLWREPLLHFLLLGAGLFVIYLQVNPPSAENDPNTIVVDRDRLLNHMQYRARSFDPERFTTVFDGLPPEEIEELVKAYVQEEALYREAAEMQLDKNDYVARLRLIQQLEYLLRGFVDTELAVTDADIQRYWDENKEDYREPAKLTFTHVFFSRSRHGDEEGARLAGEQLHKLNSDAVRFEQAPAHGERFLYHVNYVERAGDFVASHFGDAMAAELLALEPSASHWRGPFESEHGYHLVMLTRKTPSFLPELSEVRDRVAQLARQQMLDEKLAELKQAIVDEYAVSLELEIQPTGVSGS